MKKKSHGRKGNFSLSITRAQRQITAHKMNTPSAFEEKKNAVPQCMYNVISKLLLIILNNIASLHTQQMHICL